MRDFKGNMLEIGDRVIFTDSFCRLLEGRVERFEGKFIHVSSLRNQTGQSKAVRGHAIMKL